MCQRWDDLMKQLCFADYTNSSRMSIHWACRHNPIMNLRNGLTNRDPRGRQKRAPFPKKCVKHAYPGAESGFRSANTRNPEMIADLNGIDFGTKTHRFGHFPGPSYNGGAHAGWPAARLGGTSKPLIIWDTKKRQKRVPLAKKSANIMYP